VLGWVGWASGGPVAGLLHSGEVQVSLLFFISFIFLLFYFLFWILVL
jgi:hypothetical protein